MKISEPVLVCVTPQLSCDKLINMAKEFAEKLNRPLYVVTVLKKNGNANKKSNEIKNLNSLSKRTQCNIDIIYSDNVAQSLGYYINKAEPFHIFIGNPVEGGRFFEEFMSNIYRAPVSVVNSDDEIIYTLPSSTFEAIH